MDYLSRHFVGDWAEVEAGLGFHAHLLGCAGRTRLRNADVARDLIHRSDELDWYAVMVLRLYRTGGVVERHRVMVGVEEASQVDSSSYLDGSLGSLVVCRHVDVALGHMEEVPEDPRGVEWAVFEVEE